MDINRKKNLKLLIRTAIVLIAAFFCLHGVAAAQSSMLLFIPPVLAAHVRLNGPPPP